MPLPEFRPLSNEVRVESRIIMPFRSPTAAKLGVLSERFVMPSSAFALSFLPDCFADKFARKSVF